MNSRTSISNAESWSGTVLYLATSMALVDLGVSRSTGLSRMLWLCGLQQINYRTLSRFGSDYQVALDTPTVGLLRNGVQQGNGKVGWSLRYARSGVCSERGSMIEMSSSPEPPAPTRRPM